MAVGGCKCGEGGGVVDMQKLLWERIFLNLSSISLWLVMHFRFRKVCAHFLRVLLKKAVIISTRIFSSLAVGNQSFFGGILPSRMPVLS